LKIKSDGDRKISYAGDHLLTTTSNQYFHHHDNMSWEQTSRYILDTLSVWNQHPGMPLKIAPPVHAKTFRKIPVIKLISKRLYIEYIAFVLLLYVW